MLVHQLNERIDARGHTSAVQMLFHNQEPPWTEYYTRWYNLNKDPLGGFEGPFILNLKRVVHHRIDSRGHTIAVGVYIPDPHGVFWFDLNGNNLGAVTGGGNWVNFLRYDSRGHKIAVYPHEGPWYNLNGKPVS
jgi:hypothetical protein